jgi:hypothetical protein
MCPKSYVPSPLSISRSSKGLTPRSPARVSSVTFGKIMKNVDVDELIARIEGLPAHDVIKALATPGDYTPEAMMIYEAEAARRGISTDAVRPVALKQAQSRKDKMAVARSFKGIGERLYGKRSFGGNGSYQTTKWFVFFYLPIYPISSFRVTREDNGGISVVEVLPIDKRQVVDTYCFVALSWASVAVGIRFLERYSLPFSEFISVALLALPALFLFVIRRRARRHTAG